MSASITCDKCGTSTPNTPDDILNWLNVGYAQTTAYDVCSYACARAMLKSMEVVFSRDEITASA